jgi:gliding motility-associated-like protein
MESLMSSKNNRRLLTQILVFSGLVFCPMLNAANPIANDAELWSTSNRVTELVPLYSGPGTKVKGNHQSIGQQSIVCELNLYFVPADVTINCTELTDLIDPVVMDANADCCDPVTLTLELDTIPGVCPVLFTIVRTWTVADECGDSLSDQQLVTVMDNQVPVFTQSPPNLTVSCDAIPPVPVIGIDVQATDDCNGQVSITASSIIVPGICAQQYVINRTWVARDACQNSSYTQQMVLVQDHQAPEFITPPQDLTIHCLAPAPPVDTIMAEDNCSQQVWFTFTESLSGGSYCNTITRIRTWTAEDMCGNANTHTQTITQTDAGPPVLSNIPANTTAECGALPDDEPSVMDDCDQQPLLNVSSTIIPGSCPGNYTLIKTWTALDECGNSSTASQSIVVTDTKAPIITFSHPLLASLANGDTMKVACEASVIFGVNDATVVDACDNAPEVIFIDSLIFNDGCKKLLYCEWRATDFCGNVNSFIFYMLVGDFTAPVITGVPANSTISCNAPIPTPGNPTVEDDCDLGPKLNLTETILPGSCPQSYQIIRTWTANDFCGNSSTKSQVITVSDNQAPVMTAVHPLLIGKPNGSIISVECGSEPQFTAGAFNAVDNCDLTSSITIASNSQDGNCQIDGYLRQITYTWTAVDDCGNQSTYTVYIRVVDTTPPVFTTFPADATISCDQQPPTTQPSATDPCSPPAVITQTQVSVNLNCGYRIDRTWRATDLCGNFTTSIQRITVIDDKAPLIGQIPSDITLFCEDPIPAAPIVTVTDNCDLNVNIQLSASTIQGNCPGNYEIIRRWTATDNCGNSSFKTQRITVRDTTPPTFITLPVDGTVSCDDVPSGIGNLTATDNCSGQVNITVENNRVNGSCENSYFLARVFTANDGCGNTTTHVQKLVVVDEEPPVFDMLPQNLTIECSEINPLPVPKVTDNCDDEVTLTYTSVVQQNGHCVGTYTLLATWTATDNCNNTATATQIFHVVDSTPPVLTPLHPAIINVPNGTELTAECDNVPIMSVTDVQTVDQCDPNPEVTFTELVEHGDCSMGGFLYKLTCTWTATDSCGNSASYTIFVRVVDTKAPVFSGSLSDITINVKNGEQVPAPAQVLFSDACDTEPKVTLEETILQQDCGYLLQRTWTAIDDCGNSSTVSQQITVIEGCPCQKPTVASIDIIDPKYGLSNGAITINLVQDESNYSYLWIPDLGVTNNIGNSKTNLPEGTYQLFIKDPLADASCFVKLTLTLEMRWSCIDTVYLSIPIGDPYEACVDSVLDYPGNTTTAILCGLDSSVISSVVFSLPSGCVTIDPKDDFVGQTEICVIHCDNSNPSICDTTYLIISVTGIKPCEDLFTASLYNGETENCDLEAGICLPITPLLFSQYDFSLDGVAYSQPAEGCDFLSTFSYNQVAIPAGGNLGPYAIDTWMINGLSSTGFFDNIETLLIWMNQRDPTGNWYFDASTGQILGGNAENIYGPLIIRQLNTNNVVSLGLQQLNIPQGTIVFATEGEHLFQSTHKATGCKDEIFLSVTCIGKPDSINAVDDAATTTGNQSMIIPVIQNDIIPGGILTDMFILSYPVNGTVMIRPDHQILYLPNSDFCDVDSFKYVICNNINCDTATVWITVNCGQLVIHNGFSPNGDGINDGFAITGIEAFPENELIVFNRWGNEVYKQKGYKNQWLGTWEGGDLPDGTYFYLFDDGTGQLYRGYVQINR